MSEQIETEVVILKPEPVSYWSASDLIRMAEEQPPKPIIESLLYEGDTFLIHGSEENYKSFLMVQIAESIASGTPLLRSWAVNQSRRVGIIETEMHSAQLGQRLKVMYPDGKAPEGLCFFPDSQMKEWRVRTSKVSSA